MHTSHAWEYCGHLVYAEALNHGYVQVYVLKFVVFSLWNLHTWGSFLWHSWSWNRFQRRVSLTSPRPATLHLLEPWTSILFNIWSNLRCGFISHSAEITDKQLICSCCTIKVYSIACSVYVAHITLYMHHKQWYVALSMLYVFHTPYRIIA